MGHISKFKKCTMSVCIFCIWQDVQLSAGPGRPQWTPTIAQRTSIGEQKLILSKIQYAPQWHSGNMLPLCHWGACWILLPLCHWGAYWIMLPLCHWGACWIMLPLCHWGAYWIMLPLCHWGAYWIMLPLCHWGAYWIMLPLYHWGAYWIMLPLCHWGAYWIMLPLCHWGACWIMLPLCHWGAYWIMLPLCHWGACWIMLPLCHWGACWIMLPLCHWGACWIMLPLCHWGACWIMLPLCHWGACWIMLPLCHWGACWILDNISHVSGLLLGGTKPMSKPKFFLSSIRSGGYAKFPPQPPGSIVLWGAEWPKFDIVIQGKCFIWTMTFNSSTANEKHGIPSQILKSIFGLRASVIFKMCMVSGTFVGSSDPPLIPNCSGQLAELVVYIIPSE